MVVQAGVLRHSKKQHGICFSADVGRADLIKIYPNPLTGGSLSVDVPTEWGSSTMIVYSDIGRKNIADSLKIGILVMG